MIAYFKSKDGRVISRHYQKRAAPKAIFDGDAWYDRDDDAEPPPSLGSPLPAIHIRDNPVVSIQAPLKGSRWDDPLNPAPHYTKSGQAVFSNRRQMKEWAKRSETEHGTYDVDD